MRIVFPGGMSLPILKTSWTWASGARVGNQCSAAAGDISCCSVFTASCTAELLLAPCPGSLVLKLPSMFHSHKQFAGASSGNEPRLWPLQPTVVPPQTRRARPALFVAPSTEDNVANCFESQRYYDTRHQSAIRHSVFLGRGRNHNYSCCSLNAVRRLRKGAVTRAAAEDKAARFQDTRATAHALPYSFQHFL